MSKVAIIVFFVVGTFYLQKKTMSRAILLTISVWLWATVSGFAQEVSYSLFVEPFYNGLLVSRGDNGDGKEDLRPRQEGILSYRLGATGRIWVKDSLFIRFGLQIAKMGFNQQVWSFEPDGVEEITYRERNVLLEIPTGIGWTTASPLSENTIIHLALLHQLFVRQKEPRGPLPRAYRLGVTSGITYQFATNEHWYWEAGPTGYFALTDFHEASSHRDYYPYSVGVRLGIGIR